MTGPKNPTTIKRTRRKTPHATIPEAERRERGQVLIAFRTTDKAMVPIRLQYGQFGESDSIIVKRACGLFGKKDA